MAKAKKMRERFFRKSFPHFWLGIEKATAGLKKQQRPIAVPVRISENKANRKFNIDFGAAKDECGTQKNSRSPKRARENFMNACGNKFSLDSVRGKDECGTQNRRKEKNEFSTLCN